MARVLGVLLGIITGLIVGLLTGGLVGGICLLIGRIFTSAALAQVIAFGIGGAVAMAVAVVVGVWSGTTINLEQRRPDMSAGSWLFFGGLLALVKELFPRQRRQEAPSQAQDAKTNAPFTWWVVNRLFFLAAVTAIQAFSLYFLMFAFKLNREEATGVNKILMAVVGIFTVLASIAGGWLSDRFGRKFLVGFSGVLAAAGAFLLPLTILIPNMILLYVIGSIIGLAAGIFTATNWALGTDLVPLAEAGRFLGISNLAGAGAGMIGRFIGGPVIDYANTIGTGFGYFAIFAAYGVLFLLGTLTLSKIRKTTG